MAAAQLVDFVNQHQGVAAVGFLQALNGFPRHGPDVRAAVAFDLRHVAQTPDTEPKKLAPQRVSHRLRDRRFADTLHKKGRSGTRGEKDNNRRSE